MHLPQKQKFKAVSFLDGKKISIDKANTSVDMTGCQRITLSEGSLVGFGEKFSEWDSLLKWDQSAALARVSNHSPGPFDLEVELQEEVFFRNWKIEETWQNDEGWTVYSVIADTLRCEATVSKSAENNILREHMEKYKEAKKPPGVMFGLLHYERCKLVLQPLTVFEKDGPKHLMISPDKVDPKALLAALKF